MILCAMRHFLPASGTSKIRGASPVRTGRLAFGRQVWITIALLVLLAVLSPMARGENVDARRALLIDVEGAIGFVSTTQLAKALDQAKTQGASLLIVRLDTPGGLLSSTREMIQAMLASRVPIVVLRGSERRKGCERRNLYRLCIALGCHGAGNPSWRRHARSSWAPWFARVSAAVTVGPRNLRARTRSVLERKAVNDAAAYLRTLAQLRGRNADWAEKAVREAATLTASDALRERVIEFIADDVNELLAAIDGRTVTTTAGEIRLATKGAGIVELAPDWKMKVLSVLADPNIAFLLLLIGIYGVIFEFMSPGALAPGVIGGISLIMALTSLSVLPVSYGGLALLVLGIALMVLEAFTPSFGILGLGGIVAFAVGSLFLFDPSQSDVHFAVAWPLIAGATAASVLFLAGFLGFALKARRNPVRTGAEQMIGSTGEVVSWQYGQGTVCAHGEVWAAKSDQALAVGQKVRVTERVGLTLIVEAA